MRPEDLLQLYNEYLIDMSIRSWFVFHNKELLLNLYETNAQNSGAHVFRCFYRGNKIIPYTEYMHLRWLEDSQNLKLARNQKLWYRDHAGFCYSVNGLAYFTLFTTKSVSFFSFTGTNVYNLRFGIYGIDYINPLLYMDTFSFFNYYIVINDVNYYPIRILNNDVDNMVRASSIAFDHAYEQANLTGRVQNVLNSVRFINPGSVGNFVGTQLFEPSNQARMVRNTATSIFGDMADIRFARRLFF